MKFVWWVVAIAACGHSRDDANRGTRTTTDPAPELSVLESIGGASAQLVGMSADGSHRRVLAAAQWPHVVVTTTWSSDGRYVVYPVGEHLDSASILELRADGSVGTPRPLRDMHPICALPDGRFVVAHELDCVGGGFECVTTEELRLLDPTTMDSSVLEDAHSALVACSATGAIAWVDGGRLIVARPTGRTSYRAMVANPPQYRVAWSDDERHIAWSTSESTGTFDLDTELVVRAVKAPCDWLAITANTLTAKCETVLRTFSLDGVEQPSAVTRLTSIGRASDDARLAYTTSDALFVLRTGGAPVEVARGSFSEPAWRSSRPRVPRLAYPNVPDRNRLPAPRQYADVDVEIALGLDRTHDRIDTAMRDRVENQVRSQIELFRACYRPRVAAIPGLAVVMRSAVDTEHPDPDQSFPLGYDEQLGTCARAAMRKLQLGSDPPGVFELELTFGHPGARGAVTPQRKRSSPPRPVCRRPPCG